MEAQRHKSTSIVSKRKALRKIGRTRGLGSKSIINSIDHRSPLLMLRLKNMNKILLGSLIGTAALMASAGIALADSSNVHIDQHIESNSQIELHSSGGSATGHIDVNEDNNGVQNGIHIDIGADGKNIVQVTGDAAEHGVVKVSGKDATSTHKVENGNGSEDTGRANQASSAPMRADNGHGFGKGGIRAFFSWIFGFPASTTIGDIRAEMTATTTVGASHSEGLGFWARIFGAFHFGGTKDN